MESNVCAESLRMKTRNQGLRKSEHCSMCPRTNWKEKYNTVYRDLVSQHLSDADKIYFLREAIQERLQLDWTISDDEAVALLQTYPAGVLLQSLKLAKRHIEQRKHDFVYYTQDEVLEVIKFFAAIQQNIVRNIKDVHLIEPEFMCSIPKYS